MNAYERSNRQAKVQNLVVTIWADLTPAKRADGDMPWQVSQASEKWWAQAAEKAGVHMPSEESRKQVVLGLCKLANAERKAQPSPCRVCKGEKVQSVQWGGSGDPVNDGEGPCQACHVTGIDYCGCCDERPATVVTPLGASCVPCAELDFPELTRHARMLTEGAAGAPGFGTPSRVRETVRS